MRHAPILRLRAVVSAALLAPLAGCDAGAATDRPPDVASLGTGEAVTPRVAMVDGVRTTTHDAAAFDRAPRLELDPAPVAVLGAPDDDTAFDLTNVDDVALLSDGRALTLSRIGARLLVFGRDGRGERAIGRRGHGPGEFRAPRAIVPLGGDTLLVPDRGTARWSWVHADAGVVRAEAMAPDPLLMLASDFPGAFADGRIAALATARPRAGDPGAVQWTECALAVLTFGSDTARHATTVPCEESVTVETRFRGERRPDGRALRLGRRVHVAVRDSTLIVGHGDGYALRTLAPDGEVRERLTVAMPRRAVTAEMRAAVIARALAPLDDPGARRPVDPAESRRLARETPFADSLPPYSAIATSGDGTLWVVDAIAPTDTAWTATAFRADGAIVGRLHAAGRGRPMAFEGDRVAVRTEDADGIVTVRIHRIRAAAP